MGFYIDNVSSTLQNLQNSANGLAQIKRDSIAQHLQKAQLLRDMGENEAAEQEINSAQNYGLSSLLSEGASPWKAQGAFSDFTTPDREKVGLKEYITAQKINPQLKNVDNRVDINSLQNFTGKDKSKLENAVANDLIQNQKSVVIDPEKLKAAQAFRDAETADNLAYAQYLQKADKESSEKALGIPVTEKPIEYYLKIAEQERSKLYSNDLKNVKDTEAQDLIKNYNDTLAYNKKAVTDADRANKLAQIKADKENKNISIENAKAIKWNKEADIYNANKPTFHTEYEGNEVDQQQQLLSDTLSAINKADRTQDKLAAYNRYITTGKAVSDHYGHKFDAQPITFFGVGGGGKGVKTEKINIYIPGKETPIGAVKVGDDLLTQEDPQRYIFNKFKGIMARNGITDPNQFTYKFASSEGTNELNPYEKVKMQKDITDLDAFYKNEANEAYDKENGIFTSNKDAANKSNTQLSANNPYVHDEYGNLIDTRRQQSTTPASTGYQHLYLKKK